jgi:hypothetical protein
VSLSGLLIHQLEVHRRSGKTDRFGQPVDVNPRQNTQGELVSLYPCRITRGRGGLTMRERAIDTFETRYCVYTEPDADVREDDAVKVLDALTGDVILPLSKITNKSVTYDGVGPHHLELEIWSQKGPS